MIGGDFGDTLVDVTQGILLLRAVTTLPALAVVAADVYLLAFGGALGLPANTRVLCYLIAMLLSALGIMTGRLAVQLPCTLLMLGQIVLGAASIGLFYTPALIASVIAILTGPEM